MSEDNDDEVPWADPIIRTDYEAALGRFILAFNEVDYYLSQIIAWELGARKRDHLRASLTTGPFAARLDTLEALSTTSGLGEVAALPMSRLRSLNADRNRLAHGHFDQNPFDGSYNLVLAAKRTNFRSRGYRLWRTSWPRSPSSFATPIWPIISMTSMTRNRNDRQPRTVRTIFHEGRDAPCSLNVSHYPTSGASDLPHSPSISLLALRHLSA